VRSNRRKSHVERLNPVLSTDGEAVSKLLFRPASRDGPSLAAWARMIQSLLPETDQNDTFSGSRTPPTISRASTAIETVPEGPLDETLSIHNQLGVFDAFPLNDGPSTPSDLRRMTYRAGSPHPSVTASIDSSVQRTNYRAVSPHPSIAASIDRESLSGVQRPSGADVDSYDDRSEVHATSSTTSSLSRRETILDRAFNMNYIPSTPSPSASPPPNSVARFEALTTDKELAESYYYTPDRSVMPASFFDDSPSKEKHEDDLIFSGAGRLDSRQVGSQTKMSLENLKAALREIEED